MEFSDVLRNRHMVRSFEDRALDPGVAGRILAAGLRGPSAGFTQAVDLVAMDSPAGTARYWDATLPLPARPAFPWPGLFHAPLLVVVLSSEVAYRRRYAEPDKSAPTGPGGAFDVAEDAFDVPWWHVDAAFAALLIHLAAIDAGLGSVFFRTHRPDDLRTALGIPATHAPVGTVAVGHARTGRVSTSVAMRTRRPVADRIHRGRW